jgi:hypothetical protein
MLLTPIRGVEPANSSGSRRWSAHSTNRESGTCSRHRRAMSRPRVVRKYACIRRARPRTWCRSCCTTWAATKRARTLETAPWVTPRLEAMPCWVDSGCVVSPGSTCTNRDRRTTTRRANRISCCFWSVAAPVAVCTTGNEEEISVPAEGSAAAPAAPFWGAVDEGSTVLMEPGAVFHLRKSIGSSRRPAPHLLVAAAIAESRGLPAQGPPRRSPLAPPGP